MLKEYTQFKNIYIACGYTDLRNGIDGLARIIQHQYELDPFDEGTLFIFCGRRTDRIKGLLWEGDGFLLLYKRWSNGKVRWPRNKEEVRHLSLSQYRRLISGFTIDPTIHPSKARYID